MQFTLAMLPLCMPIMLLIGFRCNAWQAGFATLLAAVMPTLIFPFFNLSSENLMTPLSQGFSTSVTIFYLLFPSLLLYQVLQSVGSMNELGLGIANLVPYRDLQVLLLVVGLAPFAESVSGYGVGTVLVIPIFLALGFTPSQAAMLGLLGQMAVPWGGLAVGTTLGAELTNLDPNILGARTALLTAPLPTIYGLVALTISGGFKAVHRWWKIVVMVGITLSGALYLFSLTLGVELAGILSGILLMLFIFYCGKYCGKKNFYEIGHGKSSSSKHSNGKEVNLSNLSFLRSIAPYIILTILLITSRLILPIRFWLQSHYVLSIPVINLTLPLLYNPGFYLFIVTLISAQIYNLSSTELLKLLRLTLKQFAPGALAIFCFLSASQIMQSNGMTTTLGTTVSTFGNNYKWVASFIAAIGGWVTGSSVGSNALFSRLQLEVSRQSGLPIYLLMGGQNAASAHVTIVAPTRIILAATAARLNKGEAFLIQRLGPLVLIAIIIITLFTGIFSGNSIT